MRDKSIAREYKKSYGVITPSRLHPTGAAEMHSLTHSQYLQDLTCCIIYIIGKIKNMGCSIQNYFNPNMAQMFLFCVMYEEYIMLYFCVCVGYNIEVIFNTITVECSKLLIHLTIFSASA